MSVYIERRNGNQYLREDADHFNVLDDGSLVVYRDGDRILQYVPGTWVAVEVDWPQPDTEEQA